MNEWMDGWMDGWVGGWVGGWVDGWMDGWMGGWVGGLTDIQTDRYYLQRLLLSMQLHMLERVLFPQLIIKTMFGSSPKNPYIKTDSYILTILNWPFS